MGILMIDFLDGSAIIFPNSRLDLFGDKQQYIVDMGSNRTINEALGMSIEVEVGVESMNY